MTVCAEHVSTHYLLKRTPARNVVGRLKGGTSGYLNLL